MITQGEISRVAHREGMSDRVIEKDYVLTWLLFGLANSRIAEHLAFKGGTALKKIYFPEYRYSEDLDFTVLDGAEPDVLLQGLEETLNRLAKEQGFQFDVPEAEIERRAGSLTAYVYFVGPLQARLSSRKVKVDFTLIEKVIFPVEKKPILSEYSNRIEREIPVYSLEEVVIEKLCAIIGRTEPRDIYDLHFLLGLPGLDVHLVPTAFSEKAHSKGIDPSRLEECLEKKESTLAKMWEVRLTHQVKNLPHLDKVLRELKRNLKEFGLLDVN